MLTILIINPQVGVAVQMREDCKSFMAVRKQEDRTNKILEVMRKKAC